MAATMNTNTRITRLACVAMLLPFVACEKKAEEPAAGEQAAVQPEKPMAGEAPQAVEEKSEEKIEAVKQGEVALGTEMQIKGEVDDKISDKAFRLEAVNELWGDKVLVLGKDQLDVTDGAEVQVQGTVKKLVVAEIERELGWDLDPEIEAEFSDQNVIVAQNVEQVAPPSQ